MEPRGELIPYVKPRKNSDSWEERMEWQADQTRSAAIVIAAVMLVGVLAGVILALSSSGSSY